MDLSGNPHHNITYSDVQTTMYTQYKLDCVSPEPTSSSCGPLELLLWAGGTYARREADFPDEQSSSTWLETYMLPLGIKAPGFRCCRDFEQVLKTWKHAQWYGKAPHRLALKTPFPYATTSMQKIYPRILRKKSSELHSLTSTGTSVEQPARKN